MRQLTIFLLTAAVWLIATRWMEGLERQFASSPREQKYLRSGIWIGLLSNVFASLAFVLLVWLANDQ